MIFFQKKRFYHRVNLTDCNVQYEGNFIVCVQIPVYCTVKKCFKIAKFYVVVIEVPITQISGTLPSFVI